MAPAITLIVVTLAARLAGWLGWDYADGWPAAVAVGLAAMFVMTGVAHFVPRRRDGLIAIVPPRLPAPGLLVTITGILELLGASGLLIPQTRTAAAVCLFVLMLAMFPANVYAAGATRSGHAPTTPLVPRTLLQVLFLAGAAVVAVGGA
ncbi:MAG: hypothetical protein QOE41_1838 [Mycobacterium sp.]|jgi:uncharacterized membrane protein|nr:hypothetical protein [Mycobacterium sp.]MDT5132527.1 hypothetical protein [Mycobacterium sp.]